MFEGDTQTPAGWRTRAAIESAIGAGVVVGLYLANSGYAWLYFLLVAMVVGGVCCAVLCALATHLHVVVGLGYAASLAMTCVIAVGWHGWTEVVYWFAFFFILAGWPAIFVSLFCAYLKWAELWD